MRQEVAKYEFDAAEQLLRRALSGQGGDCTWYCKSFNPYPMVLSVDELEHQIRLQGCVFLAIQNIVEKYFEDHRLQQMLQLPESALAILRKTRKIPYRIGSYRTDFLHHEDGSIKICEINARFPTNGYFITHYINNVVPQLTYINSNVHRISPLDHVPSIFIERFGADAKIIILKERESDWDIVFFKHELGLRKILWEARTLAEFETKSNFGGLAIELHQDELLQNDSRLFSEKCLETPHLNDLRTIFLVHDKRLLAVFHNDEIMADYLNDDDRKFLKDNVVESYLVRGLKNKKDEAYRNKNDWVLKPNLLGKGEGILFGHTMSLIAWRAALEDPTHQDYVLQRFIKQKKFPICMRSGDEVATQELNVVGTLLCFDDQFLGPGIYRAGKGDIVNVAGGGTILFPMAERPDV